MSVKPGSKPVKSEKMLLLETVVGWLLVGVVFLLPMKFASLTGVPEMTPIYSSDPLVLFIITWPPLVFPIISGTLLLLSLPLILDQDFTSRSVLYACGWWLLAVISLLGAVNASTLDFVLIAVFHVAGLASLAWVCWLLLSRSPCWRRRLLMSLALGTVGTALLGVQQYFTGFDDTLEYMNAVQAYSVDQGHVTSMIESRRIFSTFALPNSLGGFLILAVPMTLYLLWQICGKVEPPKATRGIALTVGGMLFLLVLIGTGSRSSMLMVGLAAVLLTWALPFPRPFRIASGVAILVGLAAGALFFVILSHRGTSSMGVRLDYYYCAFKMMLVHPFCGTGWGDFFHDYMRYKLTFHREAPHTPHDFILDFASQTGVAGLIAASGVLFYPLYRGIRLVKAGFHCEEGHLNLAILAGLLAWTLHSLTDVNLQVPASTGAAIVLAVILLCNDRGEAAWRLPRWVGLPAAFAGLLLAATAVIGGSILTRGDYAFANLSSVCEPIQDAANKQPRLASPEEVKSALLVTTETMPWSPFPWASASRYMLMVGDLSTAEQFIREAIKRSPERAAFYYRLAVILYQEGRFEESAANQKKAVELYPHYEDYRKPLTTSIRVRE